MIKIRATPVIAQKLQTSIPLIQFKAHLYFQTAVEGKESL